MPKGARFFAKIFDSTGATARQTLGEADLLELPRVVREVGKPAAEIVLVVAKPWDGFGYGDAGGINEFDLVKVYAANESNPAGALVFQGNIAEIRAIYAKDADHVELRVVPIDALLTNAFFKDGSSFVYSYAAVDIDAIFADVIAHANAVHGAFFTTDLDVPGKSMTLDFVRQKHSEVLTKAGLLLDPDWYWRIDAAGLVKLSQYNDATPDHKLTLGKDVDRIELIRSIMDVENGYVLEWGGTPTEAYYEDTTSKTDFGVREATDADTTIGDSGTADAKGDGFIGANKDPRTKTLIVVNATYAIETILPGDTCQVLNVKAGTQQVLSGVFRIVRVEYDGTTATLHLSDVVENFGNEMGKSLA